MPVAPCFWPTAHLMPVAPLPITPSHLCFARFLPSRPKPCLSPMFVVRFLSLSGDSLLPGLFNTNPLPTRSQPATPLQVSVPHLYSWCVLGIPSASCLLIPPLLPALLYSQSLVPHLAPLLVEHSCGMFWEPQNWGHLAYNLAIFCLGSQLSLPNLC